VAVTEHGLLVPFGKLAGQVGLVDALGHVPFAMKTVDHSPGDKLVGLLVHVLAGGMQLKVLETTPHPLVRDEAFASASGVSDLLRAATDRTVEGLKLEIRRALAPYRRAGWR
jgi:hypothetical protein